MLSLALTVACLIPSYAGAASQCPTTEKIAQAFEKLTKLPGTVLKVKESPISGLCEVGLMVNGRKSVFYVDQQGKYFFVGQVLEIGSGMNLTQQAMIGLNRLKPEEMRQLGSLAAFSIGNSGKTLYYVTDPKCPYCKRGEKTLKKLATEGKITVQFLFFPLPNHQGAEQECVSIVCDHKNIEGLETEYTSKNQCPEGVKKIKDSISFLKQKGIHQTPVYIFPDGSYHPGLLSEDRLLKKLGIDPESKAPKMGASKPAEPSSKPQKP
jgi:thiol:disulfide interchange protein DsbC